MKASEMPFGFFQNRPDSGSVRDYYYFKVHIRMLDELLTERREQILSKPPEDVSLAESDRSAELKILDDYGRIIRHSNFITAVSMFERQFKNVINDLDDKLVKVKQQYGLTKLRSHFKYVEPKLTGDVNELVNMLTELEKYNSYRNAIMHDIGYLIPPVDEKEREYMEAIIEFLKGFPEIKIEDDGRTTIENNSFTYDFCELAEEFIVRIYKSLKPDSIGLGSKIKT
jgi:hypothetical protein